MVEKGLTAGVMLARLGGMVAVTSPSAFLETGTERGVVWLAGAGITVEGVWPEGEEEGPWCSAKDGPLDEPRMGVVWEVGVTLGGACWMTDSAGEEATTDMRGGGGGGGREGGVVCWTGAEVV